MGERTQIPAERDVRATLDRAGADEAAASEHRGGTVVVACPPHPQHGGTRADARLRAVSAYLAGEGVDCLRLDYGPWDGGRGEQQDVRDALAWGRAEYDAVGCFGYSFGACVALLVAADEPDLAAVSTLAPAATTGDGLRVDEAVGSIECHLQVIVGERDDTVDWEPVCDAAAAGGHATETVSGDHFFAGQVDRVAGLAGGFLAEHCRG